MISLLSVMPLWMEMTGVLSEYLIKPIEMWKIIFHEKNDKPKHQHVDLPVDIDVEHHDLTVLSDALVDGDDRGIDLIFN